MGTLHIYPGYRHEWGILIVGANLRLIKINNKNDTLPCTPKDAKFECSAAEVDTYGTINLERTHLNPEVENIPDVTCERYKDISLLN